MTDSKPPNTKEYKFYFFSLAFGLLLLGIWIAIIKTGANLALLEMLALGFFFQGGLGFLIFGTYGLIKEYSSKA